jgi:hypothetical protein
VNYFSHYYFDHLQGEDLHNYGLVLPDFVRNFAKTKLKAGALVAEPEHRMLHVGTEKHFSRDHRFHGSAWFKDAEKQLNTRLQPLFKAQEIPRYWFAAHLLAEMMVDRILMKRHPDMLNRFYEDLSQADYATVESFLQANKVADTARFKDRFMRFTESQYLRQYEHNTALVYSLNRIYIFTGAGTEWTAAQYRALENAVPEIEHEIDHGLPTLMEEMI